MAGWWTSFDVLLTAAVVTPYEESQFYFRQGEDPCRIMRFYINVVATTDSNIYAFTYFETPN